MQRWVVKYTALLESELGQRKKATGNSWRMDEAYIKIKGHWYCLYQAVNNEE